MCIEAENFKDFLSIGVYIIEVIYIPDLASPLPRKKKVFNQKKRKEKVKDWKFVLEFVLKSFISLELFKKISLILRMTAVTHLDTLQHIHSHDKNFAKAFDSLWMGWCQSIYIFLLACTVMDTLSQPLKLPLASHYLFMNLPLYSVSVIRNVPNMFKIYMCYMWMAELSIFEMCHGFCIINQVSVLSLDYV